MSRSIPSISNWVLAWSVVSDLVCAAFPIIILRELQIAKRNKYALYFITSLGILYAGLLASHLVGKAGLTHVVNQFFDMLYHQDGSSE